MIREKVTVADSGPLIALARIDQLGLLPQLSSRILIPQAVWDEVTIHDGSASGAKEISEASWIEIQTVDPMLVEPIIILVDRGEAEAIARARTMPDSVLLIDDSRARRVAERLGLRRIGTVGLLRRAKQAGFIKRLRPQFEKLQASGIYIR